MPTPACDKCGGYVLSSQTREQDEWYCLNCGKYFWTAWPTEDEREVCRAMKGAYQSKRGEGDAWTGDL